MRRNILILLLAAACARPETGIDNSVLTGTATIPPATVEGSERFSINAANAQPVGPEDSTGLTYRAVFVTGVTDSFRPNRLEGETVGDPDWYAFSPVADGTWDVHLVLEGAANAGGPRPPADTGDTGVDTGTDTATDTGTDTAVDTATDTGADTGADTGGDTADTGEPGDTAPSYTDEIVLSVEIYDAATYDPEADNAPIASATTDGSGGDLVLSVPVTAGGDYLVVVGGAYGPEGEEVAYTLILPGSTPPDDLVLVGAYAGTDPLVAEAPLGGTTVSGWTLDAATWTWSAPWEILGIRSMSAPPVDENTEDTAEPEYDPAVTEGADTVYVRAGTLSSLNATPSAGSLYSTQSVEVKPTGAATTVDEPLVLDAVAPKVIGVEAVEEQPDTTTAELDADLILIEETLAAQDLGMLSGLGYVDLVDGITEFDPAVSGWTGNDGDAFSFMVPETMYVKMTASWEDGAADIDFGIWGFYEGYGFIDWFSSFGDTYCLTGANPEVCETVVPFEPETTYYLVALGYLGTDDEPYHIELEWLAP